MVIRHFHVAYNAPYLPTKILHKHYSLRTAVIRGAMKNKGYAKFGWGGGEGAIRCIMGDLQVPYRLWAPAEA